MAKKINTIGKTLERIVDTSRPLRRIGDAEFAAALGAEPCGERHSGSLDLISLGELGNELIKRLRSTGGRPALLGATERCKVPLSPEDVAALEQIGGAVEQQTGVRPSLGQIAGVILSLHLDALKNPSSTGEPADTSPAPLDPAISRTVLQQLIDQQINPIRDRLRRLEAELQAAR